MKPVLTSRRRSTLPLILATLAVSLCTSVSAAMFPLTVNANAEVTFTGSQTQKETVTANTAKNVTISWLTSTAQVKVDVKSSNSKFNDTSFTTSIEANATNYPAWDKSKEYQTGGTKVSHNGKNWSNRWWANLGDEPGVNEVWEEITGEKSFELKINLSQKPLSSDSAYIPVRSNVAVKIKATPISMIAGTVPSRAFEFNIPAKGNDTIAVPVNTSTTGIVSQLSKTSAEMSLSKSGNTTLLSLPSSYQNGAVSIVSTNGRVVGSMDLTSNVQNDLSVWDVAAGIYMVQVSSPSGAVSAKKMSHTGGDLKITVSYGNQVPMTSIQTNLQLSDDARATATASYTFTFTPTITTYNDTTFTAQLSGGLNTQFSINLIDPNQKEVNLEDLLDSVTYQKIFPHRYGIDPNYKQNQPGGDFFTYTALKAAISQLSGIKATIYTKETSGGDKVIVEHADGSSYTYYSVPEYASNTSAETIREVDYSTFLRNESAESNKYELVGFLSHIGSETTGGWADAPDGRWAWGLHFIHESGYGPSTQGLYVDQNNKIYPPTGSNSYHGRGPKQLSWNYNYGQFSDFLYKDKTKLINNPNLVSTDPVLSFMSAIWFWMTPQGKKPSCHMVMSGEWMPNAHDIAGGRNKSKFGMTTNIINGGVECGGSFRADKSEVRLGHYGFFSKLMQITPENELSCQDIKNYNEW